MGWRCWPVADVAVLRTWRCGGLVHAICRFMCTVVMAAAAATTGRQVTTRQLTASGVAVLVCYWQRCVAEVAALVAA